MSDHRRNDRLRQTQCSLSLISPPLFLPHTLFALSESSGAWISAIPCSLAKESGLAFTECACLECRSCSFACFGRCNVLIMLASFWDVIGIGFDLGWILIVRITAHDFAHEFVEHAKLAIKSKVDTMSHREIRCDIENQREFTVYCLHRFSELRSRCDCLVAFDVANVAAPIKLPLPTYFSTESPIELITVDPTHSLYLPFLSSPLVHD